MNKFYKTCLVLMLLFFINGCAGTKNMLKKGDVKLELNGKGIALIRVEDNVAAPKQKLQRMLAVKTNHYVSNPAVTAYPMSNQAYVKEKGCYLMALILEPGIYRFVSTEVFRSGFLTGGIKYIPVEKLFEVKPDTVSYFGRVILNKNDSLVYGNPLTNEYVEYYKEDLVLFRNNYEVLDDYSINKDQMF